MKLVRSTQGGVDYDFISTKDSYELVWSHITFLTLITAPYIQLNYVYYNL